MARTRLNRDSWSNQGEAFAQQWNQLVTKETHKL